MKLYNNASLEKEIVNLDLGIVTAGDTKEYSFFYKNDSKAELTNIKFEISHKEVKILSFTEGLKQGDVGKLVIAWNPSVTLKEGLKTVLKVQATELWS